MRFFAALFLLGCGGDCIPKDAVTPAAFAVDVTPSSDVHMVDSARELTMTLGENTHISFPPPPSTARQEADTTEMGARERLHAFVDATNFATTQLALVHAGGARAILQGVTTKNGTTTLYYTGACSPCGGGNPGSYESARASEEAAHADRTEIVRVPRGAHVVVKQCETNCGTCPTNVP